MSIETGVKRHPKYPDVRMFLAPNGKSKNWYAGFHHGGKYVRESMRTTDYQAALDHAGNWYEDRRYEIRNGKFTPPGGTPFSRLIDPMLASMVAMRKSPRYIAVTKTCLGPNSYVRRYFGKLAVEHIDTHTWDSYREWLNETRVAEGKLPHSERSIHQMKNVVYLVMKQARMKKLIATKPNFEDPYKDGAVDARPRTFFTWEEQMALMSAIRKNIEFHRQTKTRWVHDAEELRDFVTFMLGTGLRVGEAQALRVRDVQVIEDDVSLGGEICRMRICEVTIVGGKRGAHPHCKSTNYAVSGFSTLLQRRGISDPSTCTEPLFLRHHRDMFKRLLRESGLYKDEYGRKRDFVSLRHTYICERLEGGANVWDVARNTRTSVTMIEKHYARTMPLAGVAINTSRPLPR